MKKTVVGIVLGVVLAGAAGWMVMPKMMIKERSSPFGFEETVGKLRENIEAGGWKISSVMQLHNSLQKEGYRVPRTAVIKLCHPDYAERILNDDAAHFLSVMMPCSIAVYEKSDGSVWVSTLNAGLMGRMFGGVTAEVMGGPVARETARFTAFLD